MAYIERFRVSKLAGRDGDVTRSLHRHVNIFWGLNGTGKTTLLKILHAALNNVTTGLQDLPFEAAEVTFRSTLDDTSLTRTFSKSEDKTGSVDETGEVFMNGDAGIEGPWTMDDEPSETWNTNASSDVIDPRRINSRFTHSYLPITRVSESGRRGFYPDPNAYYRGEEAPSVDDIFVRQVRTRWNDYSTKSLSRVRDVQQQGLAAVLAILFGGLQSDQAPVLQDVEPDAAFDIVRAFLSEQSIPLALGKAAFSQRFRDSPEHRRVVAEIEDVRTEVATILEPQKEFQAVIDQMYAGNKHLVLRRTGQSARLGPVSVLVGEKVIPLKSLSSGEKQLLQILLEALGAEEDTVMIDEPELSMHVDWQQRLVGSMRRVNPRCQLLLATHSPEVMAEVPSEMVFEL